MPRKQYFVAEGLVSKETNLHPDPIENRPTTLLGKQEVFERLREVAFGTFQLAKSHRTLQLDPILTPTAAEAVKLMDAQSVFGEEMPVDLDFVIHEYNDCVVLRNVTVKINNAVVAVGNLCLFEAWEWCPNLGIHASIGNVDLNKLILKQLGKNLKFEVLGSPLYVF